METAATTAHARRGEESATATPAPASIGRYRVERLLGRGGFGLVFLAHDEKLNRPVAVKIPHARMIARPRDAEMYMAEARTVARLDHPHIVPVYDVGGTAEHPCFLVSKYVDGESLAARLKRERLPLPRAVELIATLAEALHYAHARDIVHRDVKPGNVLIDRGGAAHLLDFGLALGGDTFGQGSPLCGTVAYMSPEQAAGRAHQVDGRSDIYSLGVLLYELLSGESPYRGRERSSVLAEVADESIAVRPLRQLDATLPEELERICLRALAKRPADRYSSAADMAADLRKFLAPPSVEARSPRRPRAALWGALGAIAVVAVAVAIIAVPPWRDDLTSTTSPLLPITIESVEVQQLLLDEQQRHERSGVVLRDAYQIREGDAVQLRAKLSRPAYCFWLGFQPDGETDLCFPDDPDQPPPLTDAPSHPADDPNGSVYGLTDGVGTQVFALVVSETPLPSYNEWRARRGASPWLPTHATIPNNIRVYADGWEEVFQLHRRYPAGKARGAGELLQGKTSELADLVGWLREDKQFVAVEAWALPVRARRSAGSGE